MRTPTEQQAHTARSANTLASTFPFLALSDSSLLFTFVVRFASHRASHPYQSHRHLESLTTVTQLAHTLLEHAGNLLRQMVIALAMITIYLNLLRISFELSCLSFSPALFSKASIYVPTMKANHRKNQTAR